MPNFECHVGVSGIASALAVALGGATMGWDSTTSSLAFLAGLSGGFIPDLDHDDSKPLRMAGALAGVGCSAAVVGYVTSPGSFLNRPWPIGSALLAAVGTYFLFNTIAIEIFKRRTKHRGLFHSLAVPFLYGGLWAVMVASAGGKTVMAVWLLGILGVFTHLVLDAGKSMSFSPLKVASDDIGASTRLWVLTTLVNFLAFTRLTF